MSIQVNSAMDKGNAPQSIKDGVEQLKHKYPPDTWAFETGKLLSWPALACNNKRDGACTGTATATATATHTTAKHSSKTNTATITSAPTTMTTLKKTTSSKRSTKSGTSKNTKSKETSTGTTETKSATKSTGTTKTKATKTSASKTTTKASQTTHNSIPESMWCAPSHTASKPIPTKQASDKIDTFCNDMMDQQMAVNGFLAIQKDWKNYTTSYKLGDVETTFSITLASGDHAGVTVPMCKETLDGVMGNCTAKFGGGMPEKGIPSGVASFNITIGKD